MHEHVLSLFIAFPYALAAGLLIAAACSLLGVFVILKRVVFIGITLSEMAACGIAIGMIGGVLPFIGALTVTLIGVGILAVPFERGRIPRDAVLGLLFVGSSALGVLLVSHSGLGLTEIKSLLYGDLIVTSAKDLLIVYAVVIPALCYFFVFLRPTLYSFLDREAATVLGVKPARWELGFFVVLGLVVAAASKVAGALLVFCLLIAPASCALIIARRLRTVLLASLVVGLLTVMLGMGVSFAADLPTNQTICAIACVLVAIAGLARRLLSWTSAYHVIQKERPHN